MSRRRFKMPPPSEEPPMEPTRSEQSPVSPPVREVIGTDATEEGRDPWSKCSAEEALQLVSSEDLPTITWSGSFTASAEVFCLDASDQQADSLAGSVETRQAARIMKLKLNSATLSTHALFQHQVASRSWPFLRELQLQDIELNEFPDIAALPELLVLDLSQNQLGALHYPTECHPKLMTLTMDGCDIEELNSCVGVRCPKLCVLSLEDNGILHLAGLEALQTCSMLHTVNIAENEACEGQGYQKQLHEWAPSLKRVDLHFLGSSSNTSLADRTSYLASTKLQTKGVIDAQSETSSCSCVEGNPCASNEHCFATVQQLIDLGLAKPDPAVSPSLRVNIANRKEQVAKAARAKKGIRD